MFFSKDIPFKGGQSRSNIGFPETAVSMIRLNRSQRYSVCSRVRLGGVIDPAVQPT
jgi:hypothetical protein